MINKHCKDRKVVWKTSVHSKGTSNVADLSSQAGTIRNCKFLFKGSNNKLIVGPDVYMKDVEISLEDDNNYVFIGSGSHLCGECRMVVIEGTKLTIGSNCLFSYGIEIRTGDSHSVLDAEGVRTNKSSDVVIGNHVWIASRAVICKGASVSKNSIVALGSIVTKQFNEEGIVIAGIPAKKIKSSIGWAEEKVSL